MIEMMTY